LLATTNYKDFRLPVIEDITKIDKSKNGRMLGLDYGDRRIGVAVSDFTLTIASPLCILQNKNVFGEIFKLVDEYDVFTVVVGNPVLFSGHDRGFQSEKIMKFVEKLLSVRDVQVFLWDERLSTCAANRYMDEANISKQKQKVVRDKIAASFILQGYLECFRNMNKQ
jgi:putative Holliday junction resolvase